MLSHTAQNELQRQAITVKESNYFFETDLPVDRWGSKVYATRQGIIARANLLMVFKPLFVE